MNECPNCGVVADTGTIMNVVRLPEAPGYPGLGPIKCLQCGWKEPPHACGPDCEPA